MAHTHKCCQTQKLKRGLWSPDEDERLLACIMQYGPGSWSSVPSLAGIKRCGKSCRLRWINYLRPDLKRGSFSALEEKRIIELHAIFGNKWSKIASHLPGRTDNEIKNLWNSSLRKRVEKKTAQSNTSSAHNAAAAAAEEVLRPCQTTSPGISPCMPSRPIFPFSHVDTQESTVLLATQINVDVKQPPKLFGSNPNEISVNDDLIISLQETLLGPNPMNHDELLGSNDLPRQEMGQLLVFPGYSRLQILEPAEMRSNDRSTVHIKDCQEVIFLQLQQSAPDYSLHGSSTSQLPASREIVSLIDYGAYPNYLLWPTAEYNTIDASLKPHQQHDPTAGNRGIPCSTHQLESMSQSPSNTCSHDLGHMGQSPSTTCSEDSSTKISSFFDYHDADFWLQGACNYGLS